MAYEVWHSLSGILNIENDKIMVLSNSVELLETFHAPEQQMNTQGFSSLFRGKQVHPSH